MLKCLRTLSLVIKMEFVVPRDTAINRNLSFVKLAINRYAWIFGLLAAMVIVWIEFVSLAQAVPGVPHIISYQGRLADANGNLLGGSGTTFYFRFSIYDSPDTATGTRLWPASLPGIASSTVKEGVFTINIGDTANGYPDALTFDFSSEKDVYLQVEVSSNGTTFETLSPRQRIAASGFAINTDTVSGKLRASSTADYTFQVINEGAGRANLSTEGQIPSRWI